MNTRTIAAVSILLSAISTTAATTAQSLASPEPRSPIAPEWHCRVALYGWTTALDGNVTLGRRNVPVDLGFDDVLDQLDLAAMGVLEVGCGKWSFLADLLYAELGSSNSRRGIDTESQLDQLIGNFVIACNALDTTATRCDVYAGARVNSLDADLDIRRRIGTWSGSVSKTWCDPIIGVHFNRELSDHFFFLALGDIGGFGASSDLTWQAMAAFGYRVSGNGSVVLGYRGMAPTIPTECLAMMSSATEPCSDSNTNSDKSCPTMRAWIDLCPH